MTKKCAIIVNGFYTNGAIEHQVLTITEEMKRLGVEADTVKGDTVFCHVEGEGVKTSLGRYDFAVYLDKDVHAAYMLEACGVKIFNSAEAVELCDDKMRTYIALSGSGVKMPYTVSSPVMYRDADDGGFLDRVEKRIKYPIVVKEAFGSMGRGVHLAEDRAELQALRDRLKLSPHIYQEMIGKGGEDKRVICVGGEILCAMKRVNENDFRSNIEHGGKGFLTELTGEEAFAAVTAARTLGLDYCGVDVLTDRDGRAYVCEVNSNAFFKGIQSVTGVNVAEAYARHIFNKIY